MFLIVCDDETFNILSWLVNAADHIGVIMQRAYTSGDQAADRGCSQYRPGARLSVGLYLTDSTLGWHYSGDRKQTGYQPADNRCFSSG